MIWKLPGLHLGKSRRPAWSADPWLGKQPVPIVITFSAQRHAEDTPTCRTLEVLIPETRDPSTDRDGADRALQPPYSCWQLHFAGYPAAAPCQTGQRVTSLNKPADFNKPGRPTAPGRAKRQRILLCARLSTLSGVLYPDRPKTARCFHLVIIPRAREPTTHFHPFRHIIAIARNPRFLRL